MIKMGKKKSKKRTRTRLFFTPKTKKLVPKIVNTPLDPDTGFPIEKKAQVELVGPLFAGQHIHYMSILENRRGRPYLREVIA